MPKSVPGIEEIRALLAGVLDGTGRRRRNGKAKSAEPGNNVNVNVKVSAREAQMRRRDESPITHWPRGYVPIWILVTAVALTAIGATVVTSWLWWTHKFL